MPRLLLLRQLPSYGVYKTEENGARKWHSQWEAKHSLLALIKCLLFFLRKFLLFVILLMLYHIGKLAIPHDCLFLILQILHLFLFKSLHLQGVLSIFWYSRVVLWWARDGNCCLSFLRRANRPFVQNGFVAIYFWPIFGRQFRKFVLIVLQKFGDDCVVIGGRWTYFEISRCAIYLVDGGQCKCKCKCKCWFMFYSSLWTCRETAKYQALEISTAYLPGPSKGW